MKRISILSICLLSAVCAVGQTTQLAPPMAPRPAEEHRGIPVNYDQSLVGDWRATLPDPLVMLDGRPVSSPEQWRTERRPEIVKLFETYQYGKWPESVPPLRYSVSQQTPRRKMVTVYFAPSDTTHKVDVLVMLPENTEGPVPVLLNISFMDPATAGSGRMSGTIDKFLDAGIGFATLRYSDIEPDRPDGIRRGGVRALYLKEGQEYPAPDEWGAISAWAWGVSRVIDYFEVDPDIDASRIALCGASRLGKATLWASAKDERVAVVLAGVSGEGGAALSRRNYGEAIAHMTHPENFRYQFATNWAEFGPDPSRSPVDGHMLLALIAPRPLLLQTGTTDYWSDPVGEFEAAVEAGKVYRLLGKDDLGTTELPAPDSPIYHTLGYFMHEGGHGTLPADWDVYLEFLKRYLP